MTARLRDRAVAQPARQAYRWLRKRAKRGFAHLWLTYLRARNHVASAPVTGEGDTIVSLTSYGDRVNRVAYAIESIGAGRVRPHRLILWLDDEHRFNTRPRSLRRLEDRGLEVRLTSNYGPHTKYWPALSLDDRVPSSLVTADDDILYPRRWLQRLLAAAQRHPDAVNCYRASRLLVREGRLVPYERWPRLRTTTAGVGNLATGVAGVWYPEAMLHALVAYGAGFMDHCRNADDIWLHWVALRSGIKIRQISKTPKHFPEIPGTQAQALLAQNVVAGANDGYLMALYSTEDIRVLMSSGGSDD